MNTEIIDLGKIGITLGHEYNSEVIYEKLTIVLYKGKSYISTKTTKGVSPEQDVKTWQLVAEAKDAYHMLIDAGKITLTEEEFLEQLVDATKGRYIVQGNVINAADEEDLTVEHSDILGIDTLKLADRPSTDGMGYVILRKNKTFAEQVTKENTIYEIRYDFDLNGAEVNIPNRCTLLFKGGKIKNGIIIYNNTTIQGKYIRNIHTLCKGKIEGTADAFMYGAMGDGITDDTDALNNAVQSGCSSIYIPSGRYLISYSIIPLDNVHIYGDGESTHIINIANSSWGKGIFLIGYYPSGSHYPSQHTLDFVSCTIENKSATVSNDDINKFNVGDFVVIRGTILNNNSQNTYKHLYVNKILSKTDNVLTFEKRINNDLLLQESNIVIGNATAIRASTDSDDIAFIQTKYWPYSKNTCKIAENVTISDLTISMKYPYTGSGMYAIFINGYNCTVRNVKMLDCTTPFGSDISAFCKYIDIYAEYSGGISDMAELQIENFFHNITYISKGINRNHFGESLTLGNGYGNILSNIIIHGVEGGGNVNFSTSPNTKMINCQLYNISRPSTSNTAISTATHGESYIMNCFIQTKNRGIVSQGDKINVIGCYFNTDDVPILGANVSTKNNIIGCASKITNIEDTIVKGNSFGNIKPITLVNNSQLGVAALSTETVFECLTNINYCCYGDFESRIKYFNMSLSITLGDENNLIDISQTENTFHDIKLRLFRVYSAGIWAILYIDNNISVTKKSLLSSNEASLKNFKIEIVNNNKDYTVVIDKAFLNIYN